jgi:hypothetical protein
MAKGPIATRFNSSALASMRWEPDDDRETEGTLTVVFRSGQSYQLDGVPVQEAQDFAHAISPGTYWNTYLKGNY